MQNASVSRILQANVDAGPGPNTSASDAFHDIGAARAGYGSAPRAGYQRDLVSLPNDGSLAIGADCLNGQAMDVWCSWRRHLLRDKPLQDVSLPKRPFTDFALSRNPGEYAHFVHRLLRLGLVELRSYQPATIGVFFVRKKNGRLRLIFDTRILNSHFVEPAHSCLPSPAAWCDFRLDEQSPLVLSHTDIDNAFYRIRAPPGLSEWFRLPKVDVRELRKLDPSIRFPDSSDSRYCTPSLLVLAAGWSWSLYFCQAMLMQGFELAGFRDSQLVLDRVPAPRVDADCTVGAGYVDNAAVVGCSDAAVSSGIFGVKKALESKGLTCSDVVCGTTDEPFLGLHFGRNTGKISVRRHRIWRIRLAILHVIRLGRCSGLQLQIILSHFTWAVLVRHELLSIPHACFTFVQKSGTHRRRLWSSVKTELLQMAALVSLACVDTRRVPCTTVLATDASGGGPCDFGGFGVVTRPCDPAMIRDAIRYSERWRFGVEECIRARQHALEQTELSDLFSAGDVGDALSPSDVSSLVAKLQRRPAHFVEVPREIVGQPLDWSLRVHGRWSRSKKIVFHEGAAIVIGLRHLLRSQQPVGTDVLTLCDSMPMTLALGKGRSCDFQTNIICRHVCALNLAANVRLVARWIPSELQPADAASRLKAPFPESVPSLRNVETSEKRAPRNQVAKARTCAIVDEAVSRASTYPCHAQLRVSSVRRPRISSRGGPGTTFDLPVDSCSALAACSSSDSSSASGRSSLRSVGADFLRGELGARAVVPAVSEHGIEVPPLGVDHLLGNNTVAPARTKLVRVLGTSLLRGLQSRRRQQNHGCDRILLPRVQARRPAGPDSSQDRAEGVQEACSRHVQKPDAVRGPDGHDRKRVLQLATLVRPSPPGHVRRLLEAWGAAQHAAVAAYCASGWHGHSLLGDHLGTRGGVEGQQDRRVRRECSTGLADLRPAAFPVDSSSQPASRPAPVAIRLSDLLETVPDPCRKIWCGGVAPASILPPTRGRVARRPPSQEGLPRDQEARQVENRHLRDEIRQARSSACRSGKASSPHQGIRGEDRTALGRSAFRQHLRSCPSLFKRGRRGTADCPSDKLGTTMVNRLRRHRKRLKMLHGSPFFFLELFSGSGRLASAVTSRSSFPCMAIELNGGLGVDLTHPAVLQLLDGWISAGLVLGVHIGAPCTSWSSAPVSPCRWRSHLYGRPDANSIQMEMIRLGNFTLAASCFIIRACCRLSVPCTFEHPAGALSWHENELRRLRSFASADDTLDYCAYGTRWRRRTRFVAWNLNVGDSFYRRCCPLSRRCSFSGGYHIRLYGNVPGSSRSWTLQAQPYPHAFCVAVADLFIAQVHRLQLSNLFRLAADSCRPVHKLGYG